MWVKEIEVRREVKVDGGGSWDGNTFTQLVSNRGSLVVIGKLRGFGKRQCLTRTRRTTIVDGRDRSGHGGEGRKDVGSWRAGDGEGVGQGGKAGRHRGPQRVVSFHDGAERVLCRLN